MKKRSRIAAVLLTLAVFLCLAGCKEGKLKAKRPDMDALRAAEVGSYIYFGEYEQDNNESTEKEAIEWLVLDKQEDKMFVVSRYGLDCQEFHTEAGVFSWENCSLRSWLNYTFYEIAFIPEEMDRILISEVTAEAITEYNALAGNKTMDKVFILSIDEASRYLTDETAIKCFGTPYCYAQGAYRFGNDACTWWLRMPGVNYNIGWVDPDGYVHFGARTDGQFYAVRPAMWIDLKP